MHVGNNSLRQKEPHNIAKEITDLATNSKTTEYTITVFVITSRRVKAKQVNSLLKKMTSERNKLFVGHRKVYFSKDLNSRGLNVNGYGI